MHVCVGVTASTQLFHTSSDNPLPLNLWLEVFLAILRQDAAASPPLVCLVVLDRCSESWEPAQPRKTLSELEGLSRSNSRDSGALLEQLSELHSRPKPPKPILGAILGAPPRRGEKLHQRVSFQPKLLERFLQELGWPLHARHVTTKTML